VNGTDQKEGERILLVSDMDSNTEWVKMLSDLGHDVTLVSNGGTPSSLNIDDYDQFWYSNWFPGTGEPLTSTRNYLLPFIEAGGEVVLFTDHDEGGAWEKVVASHSNISRLVDAVVPSNMIGQFKIEGFPLRDESIPIVVDSMEASHMRSEVAEKLSQNMYSASWAAYIEGENMAGGYGCLKINTDPSKNIGVAFNSGNMNDTYGAGKLFVFTDLFSALEEYDPEAVSMLEVIAELLGGTPPYQPKRTTVKRDSIKSYTRSHSLVADNTPTGTMDTVITTTVVDTITDSIWKITDTYEDGTLLSSSDPVFDKDSIWVDIISTSTETKEYKDDQTAIEQIETEQRSDKLLFAPNPVSLEDGEIFFTIPENLNGELTVTIFDNLGNVIDLQEFESGAGSTYRWDLRNSSGVLVSSGTYVAVIEVAFEDGSREVVKRSIGVKQ